jgi:hypothetical protein
LSRNGLVGSIERLARSNSLSPHHRFAIALRSPFAIPETGLQTCPPEKNRQIGAIRSRSVRSLQSALRPKYCEIRACFAYFGAKGGAVSLQSRLAGGGRGIRTPGTVSGTAVFKTARFNHSRIPPLGRSGSHCAYYGTCSRSDGANTK